MVIFIPLKIPPIFIKRSDSEASLKNMITLTPSLKQPLNYFIADQSAASIFVQSLIVPRKCLLTVTDLLIVEQVHYQFVSELKLLQTLPAKVWIL